MMPDIADSLDRAAEYIHTPCGTGRIVWRRWGGGPPVVLLHGGHGSWTHWVRTIEPLARRFTVLAPDLPGMGDSDLPDEPITADSLAAVLVRGLDVVLPAEARFALVGFSFGSLLAGHVAARMGGRVRTLVLAAPSGLGLRRGPAPNLRLLEPDMSPAEVAATHRSNLAALMFADPARIDDVALALQAENVRRTRFRARPMALTDALARVLPQIRTRIHAVWGDADVTAAPFFEERRALFQAADPAHRLHLLEGAGHWVQYEAADRFNRLLDDLLGE